MHHSSRGSLPFMSFGRPSIGPCPFVAWIQTREFTTICFLCFPVYDGSDSISLISSGKSGATTIESDHDFNVVIYTDEEEKLDTCGVSVEFDVDSMDGFRIRKRVRSFMGMLCLIYANQIHSLNPQLIPVTKNRKNLCTVPRCVFLFLPD